MAVNIIMPQMGESVAEGTILRWLVGEGERVNKDQSVVEISTDKIDTEIPAPASGILKKITHNIDETVPVGTVIGIIEEVEEVAEVPERPPEKKVERVEVPPEQPSVREEEIGPPQRLSPLVRRLAREYGVDLKGIKGTGSGGRITKDDILDYVKKTGKVLPAAEAEVEEKEREEKEEIRHLTHSRRLIAERMVHSKKTIPHVTTTFEVDMTGIVRYRERVKEDFRKTRGINLTYLPFIVLSAVHALKRYPILNSSWSEEGIVIRRYINIGIAVSVEDGLIVPVIKDADRKDLFELAIETQELSKRAREKRLKVEDVQGGTFTITNYGTGGSIFGTPIIVPQQAAILGVGKITKRPVVINEAIAIRDMVYLSLSFDHRVMDGAQADLFLSDIKEFLEEWDEKDKKIHTPESGFGGVW